MKVLLIAEGATLAHVGRPLALVPRLLQAGIHVVLALPASYRWAIGERSPVEVIDLWAQSPLEFARRLAAGKPLYDLSTLQQYVVEDLALIERVRPDCVIGDFRLSLGVSARLAGLRYLSICNAYWSPYFEVGRRWPVPDLPLTRFMPVPWMETAFNFVRPLVFRLHARAFDRLRRSHGMKGVSGDLRRAYSDSDHTFYFDIPSIFKLTDAPGHHQVVGPLPWAPPVPRPDWWDVVDDDRPVAYVSMGSSGRQALSVPIAQALDHAGFSVLVTADPKSVPASLKKRVHAASFMPGSEACARASIVICNGGSPTSQQALIAGKPVLGIASNLDQFLNMQGLEREGLGICLRADRFRPNAVSGAVREMIEDAAMLARVSRVQTEIAQLDAAGAVIAALG